jgi:hypothetical protein
MKYKATLGTSSTLITLFVSVLLGAVVALMLYTGIGTGKTAPIIVASVVSIGTLALYLLAYSYRPIKYVLDATHLIIRRRIKDVKIPVSEIRDAFLVRKESMTWTERTGGNGGLFGFYGAFKNTFGPMTWYATRLKNYIMIETTDNDRIVITPDNTEMVQDIRRLIGK